MKYAYEGVTKDRRQVKGEIQAVDENEARMKLRALRIRPQKIEATQKKQTAAKGKISLGRMNEISIGSPISLKGMMIFTRQFSSLIDAGVPVVQCLDILASQATSAAFKRILYGIKDSIEQGENLASSMGKHSQVFNPLFLSLVEVGEVSGSLDKALRRIGIQMEKSVQIRKKVRNALLYPVITLIVGIGVLIFLLLKVVPEVATMYGSTKDLPLLTQKVLEYSEWFQDHYQIVFGLGVSITILTAISLKLHPVRKVIDPLILKIPIFGSFVIKTNVAQMSHTMATLVASGVPLLACFEIIIRTVSNLRIKSILKNTAKGVSEGKSISQGFKEGKIFPPMVVHMVSIGEVSGKLDELMGKVSDIYEEEVDEAISTITTLIQPALIIGLGAMVAFLLVAMYMPIFSLADKISG